MTTVNTSIQLKCIFASHLRMKVFLFIIIITLTSSACRKDVVKIVDNTDDKYIPYAVGSRWTYKMDSIVFYGDESLTPDTFSYLVRNTIDAKEENSGSTTYFFSREYQDKDENWQYLSSFRMIVDSLSVHRINKDKRVVILNFPFSTSIEWDSNVFNTNRNSECYFLEIHRKKNINGRTYDSTSTVYREEENFFISRKFEKETYVKHIGLVYSEIENLERLEFQDVNKHLGSKYVQTLTLYEE